MTQHVYEAGKVSNWVSIRTLSGTVSYGTGGVSSTYLRKRDSVRVKTRRVIKWLPCAPTVEAAFVRVPGPHRVSVARQCIDDAR